MVDFNKLKAKQSSKEGPDPQEIFRRLPKGENVNDLYASQAEILKAWFERRNENDLMLKLHTGGGKTLVGLLIAKSILVETELPVLYLCPNRQLVNQTVELAESYGIEAVPYVPKTTLHHDFLDAKSVMVATYAALFHGKSRFGVKGKPAVELGGIICDDAHSAFSILRDQFTISVNATSERSSYLHLAGLFRGAFEQIDQVGTFDDIVSGGENSIIEVPYWAWLKRAEQVREFCRSDKAISASLEWLFLRDNLKFCHALLSPKEFVITPLLPLVDLIPSFVNAPRRVYMSATLPDDGSAILAFDMDPTASASALMSSSLAGVSERMIIIPAVTAIKSRENENEKITREILSAFRNHEASCILTPSGYAAEKWNDVSTFAKTPDDVSKAVENLNSGKDKGPVTFANRYEGIDLSDDACRILILDGLPTGMSVYEAYRNVCLEGSRGRNAALAQKIEQGAGRGARGQKDYCVVIVVGTNLVSWISQSKNLALMTDATRAQVMIGQEVSSEIKSADDLIGTINQCFGRKKEWRGYHAERLAELTNAKQMVSIPDEEAAIERKALQIWRDGASEKAITYLKKQTETADLDVASRAWLLQLAGRIAFDWGNIEMFQWFQQEAYLSNRTLLRPPAVPPYVPISQPDEQVEMLAKQLNRYGFRRGIVDDFNSNAHYLTGAVSSNQFEKALAELGVLLGYAADRPDKRSTAGEGPDVLWLLGDNRAWLIEAKSRKLQKNAFNKDDHGQLAVAEKWFRSRYPNKNDISLVSVVSSGKATVSSQSETVRSLSAAALTALLIAARAALEEIADMPREEAALKVRIREVLVKAGLDRDQIGTRYLTNFEVVKA